MRKILLITGGPGGLGRRRPGWRVDTAMTCGQLCARCGGRRSRGDRREKDGGRAVAIKADVGDAAQVRDCSRRSTAARHGRRVFQQRGRPVAAFAFRRHFARSTDADSQPQSGWWVCRRSGGGAADVDATWRQGWRHRQHVVDGRTAWRRIRCLDYGVSKGAVDTMTIGLAKELAAEAPVQRCAAGPDQDGDPQADRRNGPRRPLEEQHSHEARRHG